MANNQNLMEKVNQVNQLLLEGEPDNISVDDHGGTSYTGYKPQYVIDAMNEVFGLGGWGFEEVSSEIMPGEKGGLAIAQVKAWIEGVTAQPVGWGQNRVTRGDFGDARKGAQTDAIKKALSYFSIGNRAYRGLIPNPKQQNAHQNVAHVVRPQQQAPSKPKEIAPVVSSQSQQPAAIPQESKSPTLEERFRAAYKRALALRQFTFKQGATDQEKRQAFLAFAGPIVNATLTSTGQLTASRLDAIEAYLNAKDAA